MMNKGVHRRSLPFSYEKQKGGKGLSCGRFICIAERGDGDDGLCCGDSSICKGAGCEIRPLDVLRSLWVAEKYRGDGGGVATDLRVRYDLRCLGRAGTGTGGTFGPVFDAGLFYDFYFTVAAQS